LLTSLFERSSRALPGAMDRGGIAMHRDTDASDYVVDCRSHRRPRIMI